MRVFVAIPLPTTAQESLSLVAGGIEGARWVETDQRHVTLAFLGELEPGSGPGRLDDVSQAVDATVRAHPGPIALEFGEPEAAACTGRLSTPRVLWVRVVSTPPLDALRARLFHELRGAGYALPRHRFTPHVTVARLRAVDPAEVAGWISRHASWEMGVFDAEGLGVYSSILHPDGARHHLRSWHPLAVHPREARAAALCAPSSRLTSEGDESGSRGRTLDARVLARLRRETSAATRSRNASAVVLARLGEKGTEE